MDDEEPQRRVLAGFLRKAGYEVEAVGSPDEALAVVAARTVDLVLTDLRMPGKTGIELLEAVRGLNPEIPVVVMTAYGTVASAVDAMKRGAADYLGKPVDLDELEVLVARTLERRALVSENKALRAQVESRYRLAGLETSNARMQEAINMAARAAASRATILIHGESGTGKELLARAIHYASPRSRAPLVAVNVAALAETLIESELFGHERGAFTGADREHRGRFELADGGTLFLDEIGDLPRGVQVKLLRVLQEQTFERLGGTRQLKVDVRLVAATHRDLDAMVRSGEFREDLFFRLNVVAITLPPLRERREDVPLLVDHFLRGFIWAEAPVSSTPGPSDVPSGQGAAGVERGKELFAEANPRCTLCHAVAGKGNPQGPPLDGVGKRLGRDEIKAWIRGPVEMAKKRGVSRKPAMLPYPEFSDEELEAMVSYLVSLEPRPRP
ncbi:MAG: sigma 54-interacting transcriptional regulator [Vicinamibacteria bacterium]|nr:sigma 54-interacting transcriptional regulator [Vicinamibacteria bacterium]